MLVTLIFGLFFFPVCFLYGKGTIWLLDRVFGLPSEEEPSATLVQLAGLMALGTLGAALSLFLPLQGAALGLIVGGAGVIAVGGWRKHREWFTFRVAEKVPIWLWLLGGLLGLAVLLSAVRPASNPDTGLYHAQAIRWLETYPAVPGLGNLHQRFAYNSNWLVLNALFSLSFLGGQSFHLIPAMLALLAVMEFWRGLVAWQRGHASFANLLRALLIPIFFYTQASEISSPGTDFPGSVWLWLIVLFALEELGEPPRLTRPRVLLIALSFFALTIKLSVLPVLLIAILLVWPWRRDLPTLLKGAAVVGGLLLPWVARNAILSGYLVYPLAGLNVFSFDWKIPAELVRADQRAILAWARLPREEADTVLAYPLNVWLRLWFDNLTTNRKLIVLFAGFSPVFMLLQWGWIHFQRKMTGQYSALLLTYFAIVIGGAYWLLTAPDYRFGYGFLMLLVLVPFLLPMQARADSRTFHWLPLLFAGMLILYQANLLRQNAENFTLPQILAPTPYDSLPTEPSDLQNRTIFCPAPVSYNACWYDPFPCAPSPRPHVALRGLDFRDGFRYVP